MKEVLLGAIKKSTSANKYTVIFCWKYREGVIY